MNKAIKVIAVALLAFFTVLMARITWPYFSLQTDVKFLLIKQWVINNDVWRIAFFVHVLTSLFLVLAGFTQFLSPSKFSSVHRFAGRVYVCILLFLSGPAGFFMSLYANGGVSSRIAFTLLSILWIYFTARAWIEIKKRNYATHENFMIRSYALTLSALTLRAWKFIIVLLFHPHPMDGYMIAAWLGWIPNLLIAEWIIRRRTTLKTKSLSL